MISRHLIDVVRHMPSFSSYDDRAGRDTNTTTSVLMHDNSDTARYTLNPLFNHRRYVYYKVQEQIIKAISFSHRI